MGVDEDANPVQAAAQGATKALLQWGEDKITELVAKLRDHRLAFVQDRATVKIIRDGRRTEEAELLRRHIEDKRLREIVVLDLALRRLERETPDAERLQNLRTRIRKRHGVNGLQGAELVQGGIIFLLLTRLIGADHAPSEIRGALEHLLNRVAQHAAFVKQTDNVKTLVASLKVKVVSHDPDLFIVLGHGEAMGKAKRVVDALLKSLPKGYAAERHEAGKDFHALIGKLEEEGLSLSLST